MVTTFFRHESPCVSHQALPCARKCECGCVGGPACVCVRVFANRSVCLLFTDVSYPVLAASSLLMLHVARFSILSAAESRFFLSRVVSDDSNLHVY